MKLRPLLKPGSYVYSSLPDISHIPSADVVGTFKEKEGWTVILPKQNAIDLGLTFTFECAWISLQLSSDLEAVGLTAMFSEALASANISCNVIAAYHHDHIFVPIADAEKAITTLEKLDITL